MDRSTYALQLFVLGLVAYIVLPLSSVFASFVIGAVIFVWILIVSYDRAIYLGLPSNVAKLLTALMLFPVVTLLVILFLIFGRRINVG